MNHGQLDETLRRLAQDYNAPPPAPREEMWEAIQGVRRGELGRRAARRDASRTRWWTMWATGIAAALVVGIGLGRLSVGPAPVAVAPAPAPAPEAVTGAAGTAYRLAATQYLSQAETLITSFQREAARGGADAELTTWAADLLSTTRLLLDSPAAEDPRLRLLLEDLELVLAQISHLAPRESTAPRAAEVEFVRQAIREGGVLPKLRTAIPAGALPTETEEE